MHSAESVEIRVHGGGEVPTLIYLPGLHGDWTLVGSFRRALGGRVRFVEATYPRTLSWSLDDYAAGLEAALAKYDINRGWILGESFGSQVAWALVRKNSFIIDGIIIAGGFVRYPAKSIVQLAEWLTSKTPFTLIKRLALVYGAVMRLRFRAAPEALAGVNEFMSRRNDPDRHAAAHRLRLILQNDLAPSAINSSLPLYAFTGRIDLVVPWRPVRRWLRKNCPNLRAYEVLSWADHTVLATAPERAASLVLGWILPDPTQNKSHAEKFSLPLAPKSLPSNAG